MELTQMLFAVFSETENKTDFVYAFRTEERARRWIRQNQMLHDNIKYVLVEYVPSRRTA